MTQRFVVALAALGALVSPAMADDASLAPLPTFAQNPPAAEPPPANPWAGLYVGSEVFGIGGRGTKGGVGGDGFFGFDRAVGDNFFIGVRGSAGYSPNVWRFGPANGFDFVTTSFRAGYEEGRWKTYVMGDIGLAKLNSVGVPGVPNAGDSINNLFNGGARVKPLTSVGAGVDYAITENLTVGVSVSAVQSRGFFVAPPPP